MTMNRPQWTKRFVRARFEMFAKQFGWNTDPAKGAYYALDYNQYGRAHWSIVQYGEGFHARMRLSDRRTAQELSAFLEGIEYCMDQLKIPPQPFA